MVLMSDEPGHDDIVELGGQRLRFPGWRPAWLPDWRPGWRPSRATAIIAAAALAVGLVAGYAVGDSRGPGGAARAATSVSPPPAAPLSFGATSPALYQDTGGCSTQSGDELQLGVQITNQYSRPIALQTAKAVLPLGGLKQLSWQWGPCGALPGAIGPNGAGPAGAGQTAVIVAAGGSIWLTMTFKVQVRCPGPLPVQFSVGYQWQGHQVTASLPGFPDLSQVPYDSCPTDTGTNTGAESATIVSVHR
jgi:hypothetical protein